MSETIQTDVAIVGAGPVGLFAAFECRMLKLGCVLIDALDEVGGQCAALYPEKPIYDIPGHPAIEAGHLVAQLETQIAPFAVPRLLGRRVERLEGASGAFRLTSDKGETIRAQAVVIAAGAGAFGPNRPPLDGLAAFEAAGTVLYLVRRREDLRGKRVVIAGGGDSAIDWALALRGIARSIRLVHRRARFRAAPEMADRLAQASERGEIELVVPYQLGGLRGEGGVLEAVEVANLDGNTRRLDADVLLAFFGLSMDLGPIAQWGLDLERASRRGDAGDLRDERARHLRRRRRRGLSGQAEADPAGVQRGRHGGTRDPPDRLSRACLALRVFDLERRARTSGVSRQWGPTASAVRGFAALPASGGGEFGAACKRPFLGRDAAATLGRDRPLLGGVHRREALLSGNSGMGVGHGIRLPLCVPNEGRAVRLRHSPPSPDQDLLNSAGMSGFKVSHGAHPLSPAAPPSHIWDMHRRTLLAAPLALSLAAFDGGTALAQQASLSDQDRADLARIATYLDGLRTLKARFLQVAPDGSTSQGTAWLERPGRMRFQYDPPSPLLLVAGAGLVVFHDAELDQTSNLPIGSTPLGILLADHVKLLGGDLTVQAISRQPGQIQITVYRTSSAGDGNLTLVFSDDPLTLRQWTVLDAQRKETRVSLYNVELGGHFDAQPVLLRRSPPDRPEVHPARQRRLTVGCPAAARLRPQGPQCSKTLSIERALSLSCRDLR